MTAFRDHLLSLIEASREDLVRESADISFLSGETPVPRADVEQMLRACVAILEEGLHGGSTDVRAGFLEALRDVARTTTWELTLRTGLPCWGILVGKLTAATSEPYRAEALVFLAQFMGAWWSDVSKVMLPVFISEGKV